MSRYPIDLVPGGSPPRDPDLRVKLQPTQLAETDDEAVPDCGGFHHWRYEYWSLSYPAQQVAHKTGTSRSLEAPAIELQNSAFLLVLEAIGGWCGETLEINHTAGFDTAVYPIPQVTGYGGSVLIVGAEVARFVPDPAPHEEPFYAGLDPVTLRLRVDGELGPTFIFSFPTE